MERLTNRLEDGTAYVVSETGTEGVGHFTTQRRLPEVIARLAAYEDTGLTPEEVKETVRQLDTIVDRYGLYHDGRGDAILELLTACKAGKLAFLPCPIGSTVYIIGAKYHAGRTENWVNTGSFRFSDMEKLGVTVFLTRKEAEEALNKTLGELLKVGL